MSVLNLFVVFHNKLSNELLEYDNKSTIFLGVNEDVQKDFDEEKFLKYKKLYEYKFEKYDKLFQDCGYNESSAIVHLGVNKLHINCDFIGFTQYDMILKPPKINTERDNSTCWFTKRGFTQMNKKYVLDLFFKKYNEYFHTNHNLETFETLCKRKKIKGIPLRRSFIISTKVYEELFPFWLKYMYDIFYMCKVEKNNIRKGHRHSGRIMERVFGLTLVLCDKIHRFKKLDYDDVPVKGFNYSHNNGDKGDKFRTDKKIINYYKDKLGKLKCDS